MLTRTPLFPNPSINQQVIDQCRRICESKTFNRAEEDRQKKGDGIRITKDETNRLKNSEENRRFLNVLVDAWVKGEELKDLIVRERLNILDMDPQNSSMRKRSKQVRLALRTYYLGTQYEEAEGGSDSIEIGIDRGFNIDVWSRRGVTQQVSDVLSTYANVPASEVCARIESPNCATIRVCLTGFVELERWTPLLIDALKRSATIEFVLSHPKCDFLELRSASCKFDLEPILTTNRKSIKSIVRAAETQLRDEQQPTAKLGNFTLKWTNELIPLPYAQIDDAIYVSAFWRDRAIGDGPFFLLDASSNTGQFLIEQFRKVWKTAVEDKLWNVDIPTMKRKPSYDKSIEPQSEH